MLIFHHIKFCSLFSLFFPVYFAVLFLTFWNSYLAHYISHFPLFHCQHLPLNVASMNPACLLRTFPFKPTSKYFLIYCDLLLTSVAPGGFPVAQMVKNLSAMQKTWVPSLGQENPLEKEMATHSSILAWRIPWTEEPGRLQAVGWQRLGHDWATNTFTFHFNIAHTYLFLNFQK